MKRFNLLLSLAITSLSVPSAVSAAAILMVDFNQEQGGVISPSEAGFQAYDIDRDTNPGSPASQVFSTSIGDVTLTLGMASLTSRDRGAIADTSDFTYGDVLRDFAGQLVYVNTPTPETVAPSAAAFTLSGLEANTSYDLQIFSLNKGYDDGKIYSWWDLTGDASALIGSVVNSSAPAPTDNNSYSAMGRITSDANGVLEIGLSLSGGTGSLNGIILSSVPEPSTYAFIVGLLALGLAAYRRRR